MAWWIYKCNSSQHTNQVEHGDWRDFYGFDQPAEWGTTEIVQELEKLQTDDEIIAYQSNRNEIVGTARVARLARRGKFRDVYLQATEIIGAKVRPLKARDAKLAAIPALSAGPIHTIYAIDTKDAARLLQAARRSKTVGLPNDSWRMAFRVGDGGESLFPQCAKLGVAAIFYPALTNTDLSLQTKGEPKRNWAKLHSSQHASIRDVAYSMREGDHIYVKEGPELVAKGIVQGPYFFDYHNTLCDSDNRPWQHQLPVVWQHWSKPLTIQVGTEQRSTVKKLAPNDVLRIEAKLETSEKSIPFLNAAKGSGFGCFENNVLIERAAIAFVKKHFVNNGYQVTSVEAERCGYDLRCVKGSVIKEVEVKGVSGNSPDFQITANEVRKARNSKSFVACIVTGLGVKQPVLHTYSGEEFLRAYRLEPLQYRAVRLERE